MSMTFEERIEDKMNKFNKEHNIPHEELSSFVEWIIWYTKQNAIKIIKENIK